MGIKHKLKQITPQFIKNWRSKYHHNRVYTQKYPNLKNKRKIIYALTPSKELSNIGDHAQVVAIYKWFAKNYPELPIVEIDKNECISFIEPLRHFVQKEDLIFIHSGGNLGDRGIWSETGRRNIIEAFPDNKVVVLPQTIYFSDTQKGNEERKISEQIYQKHNNLTVIARDYESLDLAKVLFPNTKPFAIPDFVLSLDKREFVETSIKVEKDVLFCLRLDDESIFTQNEREDLPNRLGVTSYDFFDTTLKKHLKIEDREKHVKETLELFSKYKYIITDRFHGLIFSTILNKPTVVLPTVDHKLTSAVKWFDGMPQIILLDKENIKELDMAVEKALKVTPIEKKWNELYFDKLKGML